MTIELRTEAEEFNIPTSSVEAKTYHPDDRLKMLRAVMILPFSALGVVAGIALGFQMAHEVSNPVLSSAILIGSSFAGSAVGSMTGELAAVGVDYLMKRMSRS